MKTAYLKKKGGGGVLEMMQDITRIRSLEDNARW